MWFFGCFVENEVKEIKMGSYSNNLSKIWWWCGLEGIGKVMRSFDFSYFEVKIREFVDRLDVGCGRKRS